MLSPTCSTPGGGTEADNPVLYPDPMLLRLCLETGAAVSLTSPGTVGSLSTDVGGPDDVAVTPPALEERRGVRERESGLLSHLAVGDQLHVQLVEDGGDVGAVVGLAPAHGVQA